MTIETETKIPIWLDCDPGHDDAFAILIASQLPYFELLGISTVYGNASLDHTTNNALSLIDAYKLVHTNVEVYPGAGKPLQREVHHAPDIHGESGLDGTDLLPRVHSKQAHPAGSAVDAMAKAIEAHPGEIAVVATGTLTNIALLVQKHPSVLEKIKYVSIMGGGVKVFNWDDHAEFNIWCDPHAAKIVLTNPILAPKTFLVPLDMTHKAIATREVIEAVRGKDTPPSTVRQMLYELLVFFGETYATKFNFSQGPPVHDPVAVAALIPAYFPKLQEVLGVECERHKIDVIVEGKQIGQTVLVHPDPEGVAVVFNMNVPRFWDLVLVSLNILDAAAE